MSMPDFLVIAALIAVARWVIRSVREGSIELPSAGGETRTRPTTAKPGPQRTPGQQRTPAPQRATPGRRPAAAQRTTEWLPAWNIVLDIPEDAPRSEIQAAVKRRIARALSVGDRGAIDQITRAAATGLKQRLIRTAGESQRGKRGP